MACDQDGHLAIFVRATRNGHPPICGPLAILLFFCRKCFGNMILRSQQQGGHGGPLTWPSGPLTLPIAGAYTQEMSFTWPARLSPTRAAGSCKSARGKLVERGGGNVSEASAQISRKRISSSR